MHATLVLGLFALSSAGSSVQSSSNGREDRGLSEVPAAPGSLQSGVSCTPTWLPTFGQSLGLDYRVRALTVFDDGGGPVLYVGGSFTLAGGQVVNRIARWDGSSWSALGSGMDDSVYALAFYDDGHGPALYAGGSFTTAGGIEVARYIAKWNGLGWSALGAGLNGDVYALTVYDDGSGPALYAGGDFSLAGGQAVTRIAKWNGSNWSPLGTGMVGDVQALTVYDDGNGPALYAGGNFFSGVAPNYIAKWDGSHWSELETGMDSSVYALTVYGDGSGPALYAGGYFTMAGSTAANRIAKWDGSGWSALGSGLDDGVQAIVVYDDGNGPALYAGGDFKGQGANRVAKWDGSSWLGLGSAMSGGGNVGVRALAVYEDESGSALYVGGAFTTSAAGDAYLARWGCPPLEPPWCPAGTSASGCKVLLSSSGTASATATSGFSVMAPGVEGQKDGMFFYSQDGAGLEIPWGNGTSSKCIGPPVKRGGLLAGSGTSGACDGFLSQDLNAYWCSICPKPAQTPVPGLNLQVQLWYRDPLSTSNQTTSLSDAIDVPVFP